MVAKVRSGARAELAVSGLEALRHQDQCRVSRRLHDDIGPSLCSAGLMVGLLRSSCTDLDPGHREMLDAVQEALESAVDSVRLLSYQSAPDIERRCGLRKAVELISQGRPVDVTFAPGDPIWTGEQAKGVCRIIGDTLLAWDASARPGRLDIVLEPGAAHLRAPAGGLLTEATLEAVRMVAAWTGLSINYRDSSVSELSVTPGKERQ